MASFVAETSVDALVKAARVADGSRMRMVGVCIERVSNDMARNDMALGVSCKNKC